MSKPDAAVIQQIPTGAATEVDVGSAAADRLRAAGFPEVADDLEKRISFGEKKYGQRLKTNNGRNALLDCYQEALDGINYSMQCHLEGLDDGDLFAAFSNLSVKLEQKLRTV